MTYILNLETATKNCSVSISQDGKTILYKEMAEAGLRIGVSAAKGLCFALDLPLISVDTLQVLASQLSITEGVIIPMIDARRMEVYSAIYNSNYEKIREVQAEILTENSFEEISETIHFVGDCAEKAKTVLTNTNFIFHEEIFYPSANEISALSYQKFQQSKFEDVAYFEPYYLKDFMATVAKK